jgi:hypothetical protein
VGFRVFLDRDGVGWEVRPRSKDEWAFEPAGENPGPARSAAAPGYERDPYELSQEELQRLLDSARAATRRDRPSPFKD